MAKELTDDELNLRRKARRRLIGASALTLAVVVILPMVLDSEPKPDTQDIDLRIPNPDKTGAFVPGVAVSEVVEAMPPAASAVVPESAVAVVSAPSAIPVDAAPPVAAADAVKPVMNETGVEASNKPQLPAKADERKPVAKDEPKVGVKAVAKTEELKAAAKSEDKQDGAGYAAQVGAYSNAATAK